jgi:hypothetical protein
MGHSIIQSKHILRILQKGGAAMSTQREMRGERTRNAATGRLRQVRSDKHMQSVRDQYSRSVAPGRGDMHVGTARKRSGKSLTKLLHS